MKKPLSTYEIVREMLKREKPKLRFNAETIAEYRVWRKKFKTELLRRMGKFPDKVPLRPELVERKDFGSYIREKILIASDKYAYVPLYVLIPKGINKGEKIPAVLACHGHGWGKGTVVGINDDGSGFKNAIGSLFADRGYVVIAPDWRGFGERRNPDWWVRQGRDSCNVGYLAMGYFGYNLLALNVWDGMRTLDYLCARKEVDPDRIGCVGVSFGGTMTTYLSGLDDRIKVACISGYLSTVRRDALGERGKANTCGSQYMPGLIEIGDISDVASLIAPKPLLIEMGMYDDCFEINDAKRAYRDLRKVYRVLGVTDRIDADVFPGPHQFSGRKAFDWFAKWLSFRL